MGPYKIATIEPFYNYKVNSFVRKYIDYMCRLAGLSTFTNSTFTNSTELVKRESYPDTFCQKF